MITMYRGYELIEEKTGKCRFFVYEPGSESYAKAIYIADDYADLDGFIDANPAPRKELTLAAPQPAQPVAGVGAEQMARTLDDLAGDHVRFRMMLATALGLDDNELLDESNDEICERVTAIRARLAQPSAAGVEGSKFIIGQEVIVLDGTSLVGKIIGRSETADAYKVAVEGSTGRWYDASDLAAV